MNRHHRPGLRTGGLKASGYQTMKASGYQTMKAGYQTPGAPTYLTFETFGHQTMLLPTLLPMRGIPRTPMRRMRLVRCRRA